MEQKADTSLDIMVIRLAHVHFLFQYETERAQLFSMIKLIPKTEHDDIWNFILMLKDWKKISTKNPIKKTISVQKKLVVDIIEEKIYIFLEALERLEDFEVDNWIFTERSRKKIGLLASDIRGEYNQTHFAQLSGLCRRMVSQFELGKASNKTLNLLLPTYGKKTFEIDQIIYTLKNGKNIPD